VPTYDYRCEAGHRYEKRESFGSPTTHPCERCGKPAQRQLSAPPIVFKGTGWYKTSSRSSSAAAAGSERGDSSSSDAGSKASTKATPAAKSDSSSGAKKSSAASNGASGSD